MKRKRENNQNNNQNNSQEQDIGTVSEEKELKIDSASNNNTNEAETSKPKTKKQKLLEKKQQEIDALKAVIEQQQQEAKDIELVSKYIDEYGFKHAPVELIKQKLSGPIFALFKNLEDLTPDDFQESDITLDDFQSGIVWDICYFGNVDILKMIVDAELFDLTDTIVSREVGTDNHQQALTAAALNYKTDMVQYLLEQNIALPWCDEPVPQTIIKTLYNNQLTAEQKIELLMIYFKYSQPNIDERTSIDITHEWIANHIIIYLKDFVKTENDINLYKPLLDLCFAKKGSINYLFDGDGTALEEYTSALDEALKAPHSAYAKMILQNSKDHLSQNYDMGYKNTAEKLAALISEYLAPENSSESIDTLTNSTQNNLHIDQNNLLGQNTDQIDHT